MGIGGSGLAGIAQIAKAYGFQVTGCDIAAETSYLKKVTDAGIPVFLGHDPAHLKKTEILAVSPAIFYQNDDHPETALGRKRKILMKWQEFMGTYLHRGKFVICIAGTHGKSTTTALAGHLLETADLDPTVEIGATDPIWHNNVRIGKSPYFISEADEFHDNFASYHPDVIILNNLEMDHPEYFTSEQKLLSAYQNFINHLKPLGRLIFNTDSPLLHKLHLPSDSIPYSLNAVQNIKLTPTRTSFNYQSHQYQLKIPGLHNISNSLGIIELARILKIPISISISTLKSFQGVGRRLELIGEKSGIKVYDDYANHPTAFAATIQACRQINPEGRLWVVIEPHTFSRLRSLLPQLPASLTKADQIIVSKIFASRETDPGDFSGADIAAAAKHPHARYIPDFPDIAQAIKQEASPGDTILVMGSGLSHKLSRQILHDLKN